MFRKFFSRLQASAPVTPQPDFIGSHMAAPLVADDLSDSDIERLNKLLPWAAFTLDSQGRRLGRAHSRTKRAHAQAIPDPRIEEFDRRYGIGGKAILEVGCFEGIHTIALARFGGSVFAVDSRIENVAKTAVRCAVYGVPVQVGVWDVELPAPNHVSLTCDLLHHVGVLYHLADPVSHLTYLLPNVRCALMLDTHLASPDRLSASYQVAGQTYDYEPFRERGRKDPFSGMQAHSKWLSKAALLKLLREAGFEVDAAEVRNERNGLRVLIYASRKTTD